MYYIILLFIIIYDNTQRIEILGHIYNINETLLA